MAQREIPIKESSNIQSPVLYDDDTQVLTVAFKKGSGVYEYHGVSADTAAGFSQADSAGGYLHSFVKNLHEYKKIG